MYFRGYGSICLPYFKGKIKLRRVLLVNFVLILLVCFVLYFILDSTLAKEQEGTIRRKPTPFLSRFSSNKNESLNNDRLKQIYIDLAEDKFQCSAPVAAPQVNIQMGHLYEHTIPFDNIDGGVWKQGWNVMYSSQQWNKENKLKIFVVPHSHNDPGWKKTFEDYYTSQTRSILNNMVIKLLEDQRRKFIWAEISFFSLWWSEIAQNTKEQVKRMSRGKVGLEYALEERIIKGSVVLFNLLTRGQLEIVTGGWVMADEANSHYYSVIEQLIHGHHWLMDNLGYQPKYSWSIDPFGLSPTFPFILKEADFRALVVQRSHYSVKKHLARNKQLEFRWRQLWDKDGWTELLTHMMPFYSYDIPHTCGPDPKICCQFDFKRLPGYGVSCPWRISPQPITQVNVAHRAELLLDQYRKKAQLYSTNVLLVPLGDDFRYDHSTEWDAQFNNYQKIFDYINQNPELNTHAQFATLSDYFEALIEEKPSEDFPTLSGDFFTYADRENHYWSGYYTSRPFYKRMDRVLITYLRSAEILFSLATRVDRKQTAWKKLQQKVNEARSSLSLFQHHDGITGTAKDHVVQDYASKMLDALHKSEHVIQQCANFLLSGGKVSQTGDEQFFILDDHQKLPYSLPEQTIISFPSDVTARRVVFFNPLGVTRKEVVTLRVENRLVQVRDGSDNIIGHQVSPICGLNLLPSSCYQLSFVVSIGPLALVTYTIEPSNDDSEAHVTLKLFDANLAYLYEDWENKDIDSAKDFTIQNNNVSIAFNKDGFLKAITLKQPDNMVTLPFHLNFVRYSTQLRNDKSGAYLFLPDGEAEKIKLVNPKVIISEGRIMSQVIVQMPNIVHSVILYNSGGSDGYGIEIQNLVNIATVKTNYELAMRFSTDIKNENVFYTDLNGLQMIKRKKLMKLPLQGNYYPMPSSIYIEDKNTRISVLSAQPLGAASLHDGEIEIMQDRRLLQDDNRGLDQPVIDNRPTLAIFRVVVESRSPGCTSEGEGESVWGQLSGAGYSSLQSLLHPVKRLLYEDGTPHQTTPSYNPPGVAPLPPHLHLVTSHVRTQGIGFVLSSVSLHHCYPDPAPHLQPTITSVNLSHVIPLKSSDRVFKSTLTFSKMVKEVLETEPQVICENDIKAFFIREPY